MTETVGAKVAEKLETRSMAGLHHHTLDSEPGSPASAKIFDSQDNFDVIQKNLGLGLALFPPSVASTHSLGETSDRDPYDLHLADRKERRADSNGPARSTDEVPLTTTVDNPEYPQGWTLGIIIVALCFGTLLVAIDNTIIGVAIPKISTQFHALNDIGWYGSAYLVTVTAFQPSFGKIFKLFNVKSTYLVSILIFEAGSTLCAAAPSSVVFIIGRAISGIGAAGLYQGALSIVGFSVPLNKRPLYLGIVVSVFGIAVCFGPILGGAFTDHATWRWCFWINLPIGAVVSVLILSFLRLRGLDNRDRRLPLKERMRNLDFVGASLLVCAVVCLLLAMQWGGTTYAWGSSRIVGLLTGAALIATVFGILQWKLGERATIPFRVMLQRSVLMGSIFVFFMQMSSFSIAYYLPFYFQAVQGVSATTSGLRYMALALPMIVGVVVIGALVTVLGVYVPFMILGQTLAALGFGLLTRIRVGTPTVEWAAYLVVAGLGQGIAMQMPYIGLQVVLSEDDIPIGNAITVFFFQLGGSLAVGIGQNIFVNGLSKEVARRTSAISPKAVIAAGATQLKSLTTDPTVLLQLKEAYSTAVTNTLILTVVAACLAVPFAFGMEWKNVKKEAAIQKEEKRLRAEGQGGIELES